MVHGRWCKTVLWFSMLLCIVILVGGSATAARKWISIATAGMGGSYYPIGVGIAEIINKNVPGVEAQVEVTGGSIENVRLVGTGQSDIGITMASTAYFGYNGKAPYDRAYTDVVLLFSGISPGAGHMVVLEGSPIKSFNDLKGKRVAVGPQGGGAIVTIIDILAAHGMSYEDIRPVYISYEEGVQALVDGNVDAAFVMAAPPAPAVSQLASTHRRFRFLELSTDAKEKLRKNNPYYVFTEIPTSTYGLDREYQLVAVPLVVIINRKLDEKLVYDITKAIFNNLSMLHDAHPAARTVTLENASVSPIPIHPGAERFYKEVGVLK